MYVNAFSLYNKAVFSHVGVVVSFFSSLIPYYSGRYTCWFNLRQVTSANDLRLNTGCCACGVVEKEGAVAEKVSGKREYKNPHWHVVRYAVTGGKQCYDLRRKLLEVIVWSLPKPGIKLNFAEILARLHQAKKLDFCGRLWISAMFRGCMAGKW